MTKKVFKITTGEPIIDGVPMSDIATSFINIADSPKQKSPFRQQVINNEPVVSITKRESRGKNFTELGKPGLINHGGFINEEFLPELKGHSANRIYTEMKDNDATIGAMLYTIEQLIQRAAMKIIAPPGKEGDTKDAEMQKKIDLVETARHDMSRTWSHTMSEILTFLPFGYAWMEVTMKQRSGENRNVRFHSNEDDNLIGWRGIELRGQDSTWRWEMDDAGEILALWQRPAPTYDLIRIPMAKSLLFRLNATKNNPEGRSILRNSYRSWFFKKRFEEIEGIAFERDLTGLPVLTPPEGYNLWNANDDDAAALLAKAEEIVRNVRMDQHMGIVLPFGWTLALMTSGQRSLDTTVIIGRLEQRMAVTVLADMLLIGQDRVGSFALVSAKVQLFSSALESITKNIADVFNRDAIPRLMRANGFSLPYPIMHFGPVETIDLKSLAEFFNKTVASGIITPSDATEAFVRQRAGLPELSSTDVLRAIPGLEPPGEEADKKPTDSKGENPSKTKVPAAGKSIKGNAGSGDKK